MQEIAHFPYVAGKILRLHDQEHGSKYNCLDLGVNNPDCLDNGYDANGKSNDPVVCQVYHYTPALDLAQLGPLGPENDGTLVLNGVEVSPSTANGRDQLKQSIMSNVMHSHHGEVDVNGLSPGDTGYDGNNLLFVTMPPAINAQQQRRDPITTQTILEETCYRCHPGKRTQCMRRAMANSGLVCQGLPRPDGAGRRRLLQGVCPGPGCQRRRPDRLYPGA